MRPFNKNSILSIRDYANLQHGNAVDDPNGESRKQMLTALLSMMTMIAISAGGDPAPDMCKPHENEQAFYAGANDAMTYRKKVREENYSGVKLRCYNFGFMHGMQEKRKIGTINNW